MSGWIKIDKALIDTIKFRRVVRAVKSNALRGVTDVSDAAAVAIVLGALVRLWVYADTHISDDDTLAITPDEINDLVGVEGFAQALPAEWLHVVDADHVQLPDFTAHNGSSEKLRRDNAKRQADYRHRQKQRNVTRDVTPSNTRNDARPDQTRPEKTRPEEREERAHAEHVPHGPSQPDMTGADEWRSVEGIDIEAMETWIAHRAANKPPHGLRPHERIAAAKLLSGMGAADRQRAAVTAAVGNGWHYLRATDGAPTASVLRPGRTFSASARVGWTPDDFDASAATGSAG